MLRGFWDKNNKRSLSEDSDMWVQLFSELAGESANKVIYYKYKTEIGINEIYIRAGKDIGYNPKTFNYIFARGGHPEYEPILKKCKNAYKIYYGAGARIVPEKDLGYSLILCDTEEQVEKCNKKYPHIKASLWIKPAAKHFKPVDCEKEYDVCYVANCHSKFQEKIKRVKWVYKTVPRDLKVLHLGKSSLKPPKNVTVKKVSRLEMPKWYSKCKTCIVPYKGYDSAPRVISESLACDVPVLALDSVNTNWNISPHFLIKSTKDKLWNDAKYMLKLISEKSNGSLLPCSPTTEFLFYGIGIYNIKNIAKYLRELINE
jgi:hypothetical protein